MVPRKLVGLLFIAAAVVGVIFSLAGLVQIWRFRPALTRTVTDTLSLVDQALTTTQDGLGVVSQVVKTTVSDVDSLQATTQALASAIHDTNPMLDALLNLSSKDFPDAISSTQTSLASAQTSAQLIDNVLGALTVFSPVLYAPKVPLHTALGEVSTSLDPLTASLGTINTSLADGKTNLAALELELNKISGSIQEISTALGEAQTVIDQYISVTTQLKGRVEAIHDAAASWITATSLILSLVLLWLLVAQLGLGSQGLDLLRSKQALVRPPTPVETSSSPQIPSHDP